MADNVVLPTSDLGGDRIVLREISHSGDTAKLPGSFIMGISGDEGSYTAAAINGDATNGIDVDVTRVSGTVTVAGTVTSELSAVDNAVLDAIAASVAGTLTVGVHGITDNGGSLTIDAPVGSPVFVRLSDGTSPITTLPVSAVSLPLPTGASTSDNQVILIGHVDGIEALLTTIDTDTSTLAAIDFATGADVASLGVVGGGLEATAVRVTLASDSTGVISIDDNGGSITVDGTVAVTGSLTDAQLRATPVPVSVTGGGDATAANQATIIGHLDGVEGLLTTVVGAVSGTEVQVDVLTMPIVAITDNSGSLTVDAPVGTPVFVRLSDGVSPINTLPVSDAGGSITVDGTVAVSGSVAVTGPLTDSQLRATPVPVSVTGGGDATAANQVTMIGHMDGVEGLLTTIDSDTGNIATSLATVAGAVSGTEMQVDVLTMPTVAVTGTFWQVTQPVSGPLTDAQLRATPVPVSVTGGGDATAANQTTMIGHLDGVEGLLTTIDADTGNIATSIATVAGAVSGTEVQVDVITMPVVAITDNSSSLTVDAPVGTPVFVRLSDGASPISTLPVSDAGGSITVDGAVTVTNGGTFATQINGDALTALQLIDDPIATIGGVPLNRVAIYDGAGAQITSFGGGGTQYTEGDVDATITGTAAMMEVAANTLQPIQGTVADGLLVNLGSNNDVTVTGTVTANIGTVGTLATAANQTTIIGHVDGLEGLLTTIDADTGAIATSVATVAGAVSGTEMQVDVLTMPTVAVTGTFWQATQPVSLASVPSHAVTGPLTDTELRATPVPVSGTVTANAGSGTFAVSNAGITSIDAKTPSLGQALAAASVPVVLTDAQVTTLTPPAAITGFATAANQATIIGYVDGLEGLLTTVAGAVSGTEIQVDVLTMPTVTVQDGGGSITVDGTFWQATQPVSISTVPSHDVTNLGTFAVQVDGNALTALQLIDDTVVAQGTSLGTVKNSMVGGSVTSSFPTYSTGTINPISLTTVGALRVDIGATSANNTAIKVDGSAVTQPVSGTVTTTNSSGSPLYVMLSSSGIAADVVHLEDSPSNTGDAGIAAMVIQKSSPANTAATDGDYAMLQMSAGRLWTSTVVDTALPTGSNTIGAVNIAAAQTLATVTTVGTITNVVHVDDNSGSITVDAPVATPVFVRLSDGASAITTLPVSLASVPSHAVTNAGTFVVQENGSALTALQLIDDTVVAQATALGSTKLSMVGGSVTTAAPTFVTGNINQLSLTTSGALRVDLGATSANSTAIKVDGSAVTQPVSIAVGATSIAKAEDSSVYDGDVGVPAMAVRQPAPVNLSGSNGDYEFLQVYSGRLWTSATIDAALPAGTNAIGTLAANSGVDIGDVDVTSVTPGTGATSLGKAEDVAHTTGDVGVFALTVRKDSVASTAGTDGDYAAFTTDTSGRLHCNVSNNVTTVGNVAHDSADSGQPVKIGAKASTSIAGVTLVANADRTDLYAGVDGVLVTRLHSNLEDIVQEQKTNTDGASTAFVSGLAAPGAGIRLWICGVCIANSSATDITVDLRDGSAGSVLWTLSAPGGGGCNWQFNPPLRLTANTALAFDGSGAANTLIVSANGFKSKV